jgi:hypothetical protein
MGADVFVGDKGGATVLDLPAIHEFESTTGDQSQLVSGVGIWADPLDLAADRRRSDVVVLDLGGGAVVNPPRLLRFDGGSGVRTEVASGHNLWIDPLAVTVDRFGDIIVLDGGGGVIFLEPALLKFDGQTGQRSVIAEGFDLWHDAVDVVADPKTGDVFVLDLGGGVAFTEPAIRRFDGATGAASIVAEGFDLWYDATRITADANGDAIVLDLGGAIQATPPRLLRFDGQTGDSDEIVAGHNIWHNPIDLDVDLATGNVVVLDRGGAVVFTPPTLRSFDGVTGVEFIIAEGFDLWADPFAVAVIPEPGAGALCLVTGAFIVVVRRRPETGAHCGQTI